VSHLDTNLLRAITGRRWVVTSRGRWTCFVAEGWRMVALYSQTDDPGVTMSVLGPDGTKVGVRASDARVAWSKLQTALAVLADLRAGFKEDLDGKA